MARLREALSFLCPRFRQWHSRRVVRRISALPRAAAWEEIKSVWRQADVIYCGPVCYGATITLEYRLVDLVKSWPDAEALLSQGIRDPDPKVCGYSLAALWWRGSPLLRVLPERLLGRTESVEHALGCMFQRSSLGDLAKSFQ